MNVVIDIVINIFAFLVAVWWLEFCLDRIMVSPDQVGYVGLLILVVLAELLIVVVHYMNQSRYRSSWWDAIAFADKVGIVVLLLATLGWLFSLRA